MAILPMLAALGLMTWGQPAHAVAPENPRPAGPAAALDPKALLTGEPALEEGKLLYENGQYIAALGKFMTVLRREPRHPEARQYLRMVVDVMRQNPANVSPLAQGGRPATTPSAVEGELRQLMRRRSMLTLDLKAIPGAKVDFIGSVAQVEIDTEMLFGPNSGGLKEGGIPALDRVAAWLKTFGQQPVIIHCYPEELEEASAGGSLFLRRYSALYNFFVEERKLPAQRFVSADLLQAKPEPIEDKPMIGTDSRPSAGAAAGREPAPAPQETPAVSTTTARIVIETMGSQSALMDGMPALDPEHKVSRWLEVSIMTSHSLMNPEEGQWAALDLAALTRTGLRGWSFKIHPAGQPNRKVLGLEGKGNLLRRVSWDGRDEKTGSFVPAGAYVCRLVATDSDGKIKNRELSIYVQRSSADEPALAKADPPKPAAKAKPKRKPKAPSKPAAPRPAAPAADAGTAAEPAAESDAAPDAGSDSGADSVHAIWKQVIQFEPDDSQLMPTVKASLERIAKTLEVYPLQKVRIVGYAMASEADAAALAKRRAEAVRSILVNEYQVESRRVTVGGGKVSSSAGASKVEMSIIN